MESLGTCVETLAAVPPVASGFLLTPVNTTKIMRLLSIFGFHL